MPNFVCKKLSKLEFPASINGCEFKSSFEELRDGKNTGNFLVLTAFENSTFFISISKKANGEYVVKGDKNTKPTNTSHLHMALNTFKQNYAFDIISDTTSNKTPAKMPLVLEPERLANVLNGNENGHGFDFPTLFGIWNLEYFKEIRLEIGFGSASHLLYRAKEMPNVLFVGVEIYRPGVAKASKIANEMGLKNVLFTNADIRQLSEMFKNDLFSLVYMHFPVPWNESRGRRALNKNFVQELNRILIQNGEFELRSDDKEFFKDSVELFMQLPNANLRIIKDRQLEIVSKYEARWREQDKDIYDMIYICDKNTDLLQKCQNFDFSFSSLKDGLEDELKSNFNTATLKFDDFFVHFLSLHVGATGLLLKVSMGDFYAACNVYLLINKHINYIFAPPATKANAKAHEKLKEILCKQ